MDRRDFLKSASVAASVATAGQLITPMMNAADSTPGADGMIYRTFGRTGERVSAIGLGGYHIGQNPTSKQEAIRLVHQAIERGINFLDNCWDYNDGVSEVRMGKALADGYRDKVFLMTKIDGRTKAAAAQQIDESLARLQTDHVDLMQFHEIIRLEDPDRIFAEGGAHGGDARGKESGQGPLHRLHRPQGSATSICACSISRASTVPFRHRADALERDGRALPQLRPKVLPVLNREGIAPLGMKCFGDRVILFSKTVEPIECLHYCLNLPSAVQITGIDSRQILDQAFEAARTFKPMSSTQVASLLERTRTAALTGKYEPFKTSPRNDGTAHNPQWLG